MSSDAVRTILSAVVTIPLLYISILFVWWQDKNVGRVSRMV
jgi:hypothetical protein